MLLHRLPADLLDPQAPGFARPYCGFRAWPRVAWGSCVLPFAAAELLVAACLPVLLPAPAAPLQAGAAMLAAALLWLFCARTNGLYRPAYAPGTLPALLATASAVLLWLGAVLLLRLAADPGLALPQAAVSAGFAALGILALRLALHWRLRRLLAGGACIDRALVLAATTDAAREAARRIETETAGAIRAAGCSAMPGTPGAPSMAWVEDAIAGAIADRVLIAGFAQFPRTVQTVLPRMRALDVEVTLLGEPAALPPAPGMATRIGALPAIQIAAPPLGAAQRAAKRAMDMAVALPALAALAPLLLLLAAAIRIDSRGPVLFAQPRIGFRGQVFRLLKFRTMFVDMADEAASQQTARDDRRVTRVGRVLRRLSLDELPQLLNVVRGEMSVVGPRPHAIGMRVRGRAMDDLLAEYPARHRVKPGITGWAQVNGSRGAVDSVAKLRRRLGLDCEYIERWSVAMDIWIMARTALTLLFDRHAY